MITTNHKLSQRTFKKKCTKHLTKLDILGTISLYRGITGQTTIINYGIPLVWKVVKVLEITDIRIKKVSTDSKMKAVVSVTFDNSFVVHDIKIIEGQDKLFTAMPSRKTPEGEYKDIAHPINSGMRTQIERQILTQYEQELAAAADYL